MVTEEELLEAVESGLGAASNLFEEQGYAISALLLIGEDGQRYVMQYNPSPEEVGTLRDMISQLIARFRIVATVLAGEAWYRKMTPEEALAGPRYGSLADDPAAGEMVFSTAFRADSPDVISRNRVIRRHDDGTSSLDEVTDSLNTECKGVGSWLLDLLNEFWA